MPYRAVVDLIDGKGIILRNGKWAVWNTDNGPSSIADPRRMCCPCMDWCDGIQRCDVSITYDLMGPGGVHWMGETTVPYLPAIPGVGGEFVMLCVDYTGYQPGNPIGTQLSYFHLYCLFGCGVETPEILGFATGGSAVIQLSANGDFVSGVFIATGGGGTPAPMTGTITLSGGAACDPPE